MATYENIVVLKNIVEGNIMRSLLTEEGLPFRIKEYNDPGFGSFFRKRNGWGHIAAPPSYREKILQIYADLQENDKC